MNSDKIDGATRDRVQTLTGTPNLHIAHSGTSRLEADILGMAKTGENACVPPDLPKTGEMPVPLLTCHYKFGHRELTNVLKAIRMTLKLL